LGNYEAIIKGKTLLEKIYKSKNIVERHRHRYEFNNDYKEILENGGVTFSATSPDEKLIEAMELSQKIHPFFVAVQYHPEFLARPLYSHPIFTTFIKAAIINK
jgi:CTP synthase